eukprot:TRINITY_DN4275_c0_g2_i2.p1 TRINITY_DN4275_c0_g2~~TRINITY_DN4275_c0_g2_i2.p1  ORF type:complete len:165 (-),score=30.01 TRINITY_DN4275_c0_g2_i2:283-777(-)
MVPLVPHCLTPPLLTLLSPPPPPPTLPPRPPPPPPPQQTPLMRACANGWAAVAEILLQKGANINHTDIFGRTALHRAAGTGRPTVIALLLNSSPKADIVARTNDGWTALHFAARIGAVAVASKLIKGGADVHAKCNYGFTAEDVVEQYKNGRWKETKEVLQLAS